MIRSRILAIAIAAAALTAGCSDQGPVTGPTGLAARDLSFAQQSYTTTAVRWDKRPGQTHTVTGVVGAAGGTLSIPETDFTISFPSGALSQDTEITVVALNEKWVAYDMLPHGLTFATPVTVTQGLQNTQARADPKLLRSLFGAYVASDAVPTEEGLISVNEILQSQTIYSLLTGLLRPNHQTWQLHHFSRYMLASG